MTARSRRSKNRSLLYGYFLTRTELIFIFFFLNDTAPTEFSPLPLHAALPIRPAIAPCWAAPDDTPPPSTAPPPATPISCRIDGMFIGLSSSEERGLNASNTTSPAGDFGQCAASDRLALISMRREGCGRTISRNERGVAHDSPP